MKVVVSVVGDANAVVFRDDEGVALLRMIGKAYESYLGRGESAQTIKALITLASCENTGHVQFAPKLVAFAMRALSEQMTVRFLQANTINDTVVLNRHDKDGVRKTDEMLARSKAHRELIAMNRLMVLLVKAMLSYETIVFQRQEDCDDENVVVLADFKQKECEVKEPEDSAHENEAPLGEFVMQLINRGLEREGTFIVTDLFTAEERHKYNETYYRAKIGRIFADVVLGVAGLVDYEWPADKRIVSWSTKASPRRYSVFKIAPRIEGED